MELPVRIHFRSREPPPEPANNCYLRPIYLARVHGEKAPPNPGLEKTRLKPYIKLTTFSTIQAACTVISPLFELRRHFRREVAFFAFNAFTKSKPADSGDFDRVTQIFHRSLNNLGNLCFTVDDKGLI